MPDDEPLDDARAVAAAAAAAARITETAARHVADTKARERAALERAHDQHTARDTLSNLEHAIGQTNRPHVDQPVDRKVGRPVERKDEQGYDSTEQRGRRDAAREEAGVPLESRRVVAVADQMNGQDPTLAAAVGKTQKTRTRTAAPVPDRARGR